MRNKPQENPIFNLQAKLSLVVEPTITRVYSLYQCFMMKKGKKKKKIEQVEIIHEIKKQCTTHHILLNINSHCKDIIVCWILHGNEPLIVYGTFVILIKNKTILQEKNSTIVLCCMQFENCFRYRFHFFFIYLLLHFKNEIWTLFCNDDECVYLVVG